MTRAYLEGIFILLEKEHGKEEREKILYSPEILLPGIYSSESDV